MLIEAGLSRFSVIGGVKARPAARSRPGAHPSSRLTSRKKRQSAPSTIILSGLDLSYPLRAGAATNAPANINRWPKDSVVKAVPTQDGQRKAFSLTFDDATYANPAQTDGCRH
jgi:hypothetical protein